LIALSYIKNEFISYAIIYDYKKILNFKIAYRLQIKYIYLIDSA
jgi:hypothetical protein